MAKQKNRDYEQPRPTPVIRRSSDIPSEIQEMDREDVGRIAIGALKSINEGKSIGNYCSCLSGTMIYSGGLILRAFREPVMDHATLMKAHEELTLLTELVQSYSSGGRTTFMQYRDSLRQMAAGLAEILGYSVTFDNKAPRV